MYQAWTIRNNGLTKRDVLLGEHATFNGLLDYLSGIYGTPDHAFEAPSVTSIWDDEQSCELPRKIVDGFERKLAQALADAELEFIHEGSYEGNRNDMFGRL